MTTLNHHISQHHVHTVTFSPTSTTDQLVARRVKNTLQSIDVTHHQASKHSLYILLDVSDFYLLPLKRLAFELRAFYAQKQTTDVKIALVVQPALAQVLATMTKTFVKRDDIQLFTQNNKADLWLNMNCVPAKCG
ncbi:MAG: hypothetical protein AAFR81_30025 [Chloroflexota bacterium]